MITSKDLEAIDIREGRMQYSRRVHNGGWYNKAGEKIGWGDLTDEDMKKISETLKDDDIFIILAEQDSFWNFVTYNPGIIGSMCKTSEDEKKPSLNYLAEKAFYIIRHNEILRVDKWENITERQKIDLGYLIPKKEAEEIIGV